MAATFVVETGAGLSNANSYLSEDGADAYHENHSGLTVWDVPAQAAKEAALRLATQYLDIRFHGKWKGTKAVSTQALAWPRINVYDDDGNYLLSTEIPQVIEDACAELALKIIEGDTLLDDISAPGVIQSETKIIGPLEKSVTYMGGKSQVKKYQLIDALVKQLLDNSETQMSRG